MLDRLRPAGTLADAYLIGADAGSGMAPASVAIEAPGGDAGLAAAPSPVPGVLYAGAEATPSVGPADLDPAPREGLGRGQRHQITMGRSDEWRDAPDLDGRHNVIVGRPVVPTVELLPWEDSPATMYRQVPGDDANNPPPGLCQ
jgi:hypothetical protein